MAPVKDPRDPQRHAVYDWERSCVEPLVTTEMMGIPEVTATVLSASAWLGIRPAAVVLRRGLPLPCQAVPETWTILIADWGRNATTILHEVAHLGTVREVDGGEAPHGPSFVGTAMILYARIMGVPMAAMAETARRRKVAFAFPKRFRVPVDVEPNKDEFFAGDW